MNLFMSTSRNSDILPRKMQGAFLAIFGLLFPRKLWYFAILKKGEEYFLAFLDKIFAFFGVFMRKAKSIFQGKNEPVWVRPTTGAVRAFCCFKTVVCLVYNLQC